MFGFAIAKLLAFLPGGNFLSGTLGKILLGAGLVLVAFLAFKGWLGFHDRAIIEAARNEWVIAQQAQLESDRNRFRLALEEARSEEQVRISQLMAENKELRDQANALVDRIRSGEFKGSDTVSSPVLQETIRALDALRLEGLNP